ncbi:MAG: mercury methylation corrinoid protein HgcA [Coriobacteriia bacterium]|nr:mercury methylation corrinoid protein HgcA [Coriobacteriia bacterium]
MTGSVDTLAGVVPVVPASLTWRDRVGGYRVRWGIGRYTFLVDPGLYAVGTTDDRSPVLVTANYKLSFDALRRHLAGRDAWLLALDTRGVNVWCAAGKGTFGTEEVVRRVDASALAQIVSHGTLVLPQLGAPGVSAAEVRRRTGFRAVWGPVQAAALPEFLDAGMRATPEMRRIRFPLKDRLVLVPVELTAVVVIALLITLSAAAVAAFVGRGFAVANSLAALLPAAVIVLATVKAGAILTPILLPWLPPRMFAAKGALVGFVVALLVLPWFTGVLHPLQLEASALFMIAGSSFIAMNFTGTSTFTSLSGVKREMSAWLPWQIGASALAAVLWIARGFIA